MPKIKDNFEKMLDFLFAPHSCICCHRECEDSSKYRICSRCAEDFPFITGNICLKCGRPIGEQYNYCIDCKGKDFNFEKSRSVFEYNDKTANIILNFKYNGLKNYSKPLGQMLADYYATSDLVADVATFVPMPEKRKKQRGYNQAEELCKQFCKITGMPMVDALERTKDAPRQATLGGKERIENIKGSFTGKKGTVNGKVVLLIDDVVTTGATADDCARALLKAKAKDVLVLSLAKSVGENKKL